MYSLLGISVFSFELGTQSPSSWHLAALSQSNKVFNYPMIGGEGVVVYVLDSVVTNRYHKNNHQKFELIKGFSNRNLWIPETHGDEMSTLINDNVYGVAKNAKIISVGIRLTTSTESILCKTSCGIIEEPLSYLENALTWIIEDHERRKDAKSVLNLSLSIRDDDLAVIALIKKAIHIGIVVVKSAGNGNRNACSDTFIKGLIVVGASTIKLKRWSSSNYGKCITVFAPGHNLRISSKIFRRSISGTSGATAIVSGIAAIYLSLGIVDVKSAIIKSSINILDESSLKQSPNRFVSVFPNDS